MTSDRLWLIFSHWMCWSKIGVISCFLNSILFVCLVGVRPGDMVCNDVDVGGWHIQEPSYPTTVSITISHVLLQQPSVNFRRSSHDFGTCYFAVATKEAQSVKDGFLSADKMLDFLRKVPNQQGILHATCPWNSQDCHGFIIRMRLLDQTGWELWNNNKCVIHYLFIWYIDNCLDPPVCLCL